MNNIININKNNLKKLLLATTNSGKRRELQDLLKELPASLVTPDDLGLDLDVQETGFSYEENASLKAQAYCSISGLPVLADDTGLEVDALDGAPGLHSARYLPMPGATDADRRKKLLGELAKFPRPWTARFRCAVAVAVPECPMRLFKGKVEGEIIPSESGEHGFGYDRLFWIPEAGKTMADLDMSEKNRFSHRALAIHNAIPYLLEILK